MRKILLLLPFVLFLFYYGTAYAAPVKDRPVTLTRPDGSKLTFIVDAETQGWNGLIWEHQWKFLAEYEIEINGLRSGTYQFEMINTPVSILYHETFHVLGVPDLYIYSLATARDSYDPIMYWDILILPQTQTPLYTTHLMVQLLLFHRKGTME